MATAENQFANPFAPLTRMPGMRQLLVLIGLAASISMGVTAAFWMQDPGYTVLFSNISDKESSEVINVLTVLTTAAIGRRTILKHTKQGKEAQDPALTAFASAAKTKVFGQLTIQGYPGGNFAFLL